MSGKFSSVHCFLSEVYKNGADDQGKHKLLNPTGQDCFSCTWGLSGG